MIPFYSTHGGKAEKGFFKIKETEMKFKKNNNFDDEIDTNLHICLIQKFEIYEGVM